MHIDKLIAQCKKGEALAQRALYDYYKGRYFAVCLRYFSVKEDAEDALVNGFVKVFKHIIDYKGNGSFEGWMHRIMVNECLMILRQQTNFNLRIESNNHPAVKPEATEKLYEEDILQLLEHLPTGCRTVFNMFVIEGYKHQEIAEKLGISLGTSKSQLNLAKEKLKILIQQFDIEIKQTS